MTFLQELEALELAITAYENMSAGQTNVKYTTPLGTLADLKEALIEAKNKEKEQHVEERNDRLGDDLIFSDQSLTKIVQVEGAISDVVNDNKVKNGGKTVSVTKDSQGSLGLKVGDKTKNNVSRSVTISENELALDLEKEWTLFSCKSRPIPLLGIIHGKVGLSLKTKLGSKSTFNYGQGYVETAVSGSFTGEGHADLFLNLLVVETGVTAELEAITTFGGSLRKPFDGESQLTIDSLKGDLCFNMDVFIRAGDIIMEIYKGLGGSESTLTWRYEFLKCKLLSFEVPGYKNGEISEDVTFSVGSDSDGANDKIGEGQGFIQALIDVVEWAQDILEDIPQIVWDCASIMWDYVTLDYVGMGQTVIDMWNQTAAKDKRYNEACEAAIRAALASEEMMHQLKDMTSDERYEHLKESVATFPLVQEIWKKLYDESDFEEADDVYDQIAANISLFELRPESTSFDLGDEMDVRVYIKSDRKFYIDELRIGIRCNGEEVIGTIQTFSGFIESQICDNDFALQLPSTGLTTAEGAKWEIFAKLDLKGVIKDKKTALEFTMLPKPNQNDHQPPKNTGGEKSSHELILDSDEYDIGHAKPDTMDVKLKIWNFYKETHHTTPEIIQETIWVQIVYEYFGVEKVVVDQRQENTEINLGYDEFNFYDVRLPGLDEAQAKDYWPSSVKGVKWKVRVGVDYYGMDLTVATKEFKAFRPYY